MIYTPKVPPSFSKIPSFFFFHYLLSFLNFTAARLLTIRRRFYFEHVRKRFLENRAGCTEVVLGFFFSVVRSQRHFIIFTLIGSRVIMPLVIKMNNSHFPLVRRGVIVIRIYLLWNTIFLVPNLMLFKAFKSCSKWRKSASSCTSGLKCQSQNHSAACLP